MKWSICDSVAAKVAELIQGCFQYTRSSDGATRNWSCVIISHGTVVEPPRSSTCSRFNLSLLSAWVECKSVRQTKHTRASAVRLVFNSSHVTSRYLLMDYRRLEGPARGGLQSPPAEGARLRGRISLLISRFSIGLHSATGSRAWRDKIPELSRVRLKEKPATVDSIKCGRRNVEDSLRIVLARSTSDRKRFQTVIIGRQNLFGKPVAADGL